MDKIEAIYVVRNHEGKYLKTGSGWGDSNYDRNWVDKIVIGSIYGNVGPARQQATRISNQWKKYPKPEVVQFAILGEGRVITENNKNNEQ